MIKKWSKMKFFCPSSYRFEGNRTIFWVLIDTHKHQLSCSYQPQSLISGSHRTRNSIFFSYEKTMWTKSCKHGFRLSVPRHIESPRMLCAGYLWGWTKLHLHCIGRVTSHPFGLGVNECAPPVFILRCLGRATLVVPRGNPGPPGPQS